MSTSPAKTPCDHCDGTGEVWEPCHVHADFCPSSCEQEYIPCGNCDGSGRAPASTPKEQSGVSHKGHKEDQE